MSHELQEAGGDLLIVCEECPEDASCDGTSTVSALAPEQRHRLRVHVEAPAMYALLRRQAEVRARHHGGAGFTEAEITEFAALDAERRRLLDTIDQEPT